MKCCKLKVHERISECFWNCFDLRTKFYQKFEHMTMRKAIPEKINDIREFMVINDNNDEASRKFALIIKLCYNSWYVEVSSIILIFPS